MIGCSSKSTETNSASISSPLPHSMKGYELYSWQDSGQWYFKLMTGTDRLKTYSEIIADQSLNTAEGWVDERVQRVDNLENLLNHLPKKEYVFWIGPNWLSRMNITQNTLTYPSEAIVNQIKNYCTTLDITLVMSD